MILSPDGEREVLTTESGTFHNPRVSPDGRRIVLDRNLGGRQGRDVWVLDLATRGLSRITSKGDAHDAVWTPDGHHVTYLSLGTSGGPVFTASADGDAGERHIDHRRPGPPWRVAPRRAALPGRPWGNREWTERHCHPECRRSPPEPVVTSPYEEHSPALSPRWPPGWRT